MHVAAHFRRPAGISRRRTAKAAAKPAGESIAPDPAWTNVGRSLWLDAKARRLYLKARVVLRDGYLEHLMCSKGTKEHEAILATDAVPNLIHAGLILTKAEVGKPGAVFPQVRAAQGNRHRHRSAVEERRKDPQAAGARMGEGR